MEAEIRQQVSKEMEVELRKMEELYMSRITNEVSFNKKNEKKYLVNHNPIIFITIIIFRIKLQKKRLENV